MTIMIISHSHDATGVCYTATQCEDMKGQPRGTCASGFGTCCVFISDGLNELKVLERKISYLQNPNYPRVNTTAFRETVEIIPIDEKIKQIRLDLIDFEVSTQGFVNCQIIMINNRWTLAWKKSLAMSIK